MLSEFHMCATCFEIFLTACSWPRSFIAGTLPADLSFLRVPVHTNAQVLVSTAVPFLVLYILMFVIHIHCAASAAVSRVLRVEKSFECTVRANRFALSYAQLC